MSTAELKAVEDRSIAFRDIEALVKTLSDKGAIDRANRLRSRAGVDRFGALQSDIEKTAELQAAKGFEAFKLWAETPGQGVVLTAHPTFSLSRDIRDTLGAIASADKGEVEDLTEELKTHPYLPKRAPTLIEEHEDTQATLTRIQNALNKLNRVVLGVAEKHFPKKWTSLTPHLADAYSWVGYDIDGRLIATPLKLRVLHHWADLKPKRKMPSTPSLTAFATDLLQQNGTSPYLKKIWKIMTTSLRQRII